MADIGASNWSETDASNNTAAPDGAPEGMATAGVNDTMRAMMGATKRFYDWQSSKLTGGTSTAYTLTYSVAPGALVNGMCHKVEFNAACGASPTLNINGLGALPLHKYFGGTWGVCAASDIPINLVAEVTYNSGAGAYRISNSSSFFPLTNSGATTFMGGNQALNNTANFFDGPSTGSIGATGQTWLLLGVAQLQDTAGSALMEAAIWNGSAYVADVLVTTASAGVVATVPVNAVVTLTGATTFTLRAKCQTDNFGLLLASGSIVALKGTSITAIRLA